MINVLRHIRAAKTEWRQEQDKSRALKLEKLKRERLAEEGSAKIVRQIEQEKRRIQKAKTTKKKSSKAYQIISKVKREAKKSRKRSKARENMFSHKNPFQ